MEQELGVHAYTIGQVMAISTVSSMCTFVITLILCIMGCACICGMGRQKCWKQTSNEAEQIPPVVYECVLPQDKRNIDLNDNLAYGCSPITRN